MAIHPGWFDRSPCGTGTSARLAQMVARGDLGVEVPAHEVPLIQKKLVNRAKTARIPVIIATQMMETMGRGVKDVA